MESGSAKTGTLFLIPSPIGERDDLGGIPEEARAVTLSLKNFIVENAKETRVFLKAVGHQDLRALSLIEIGTADGEEGEVLALLEPLRRGESVGIISDAGCPCVADPGSTLVRLAHDEGITVKALAGPSAILLALMSSGLNGQAFTFSGYLPHDEGARVSKIKELELRSRGRRETQIVMDTPYRSAKLLKELVSLLDAESLLTVAHALGTPHERVICKSIVEWRESRWEPEKRPTLFLFLASNSADARPRPGAFKRKGAA